MTFSIVGVLRMNFGRIALVNRSAPGRHLSSIRGCLTGM